MNAVSLFLLLVGTTRLVMLSTTVAAKPLKLLSAAEIKSKIIGRVFTDKVHWSNEFLPDGERQKTPRIIFL